MNPTYKRIIGKITIVFIQIDQHAILNRDTTSLGELVVNPKHCTLCIWCSRSPKLLNLHVSGEH